MGFIDSITTSFRLTGASFRLVFQYPVVLTLPIFTMLWVAALVVGPISFLIWLFENHPDAFADFWKNLYFVTYNAAQSGDWQLAWTSAVFESYLLYGVWLSICLVGVFFFATVGMHVATTQIRRGQPALGEAFGVASRNFWRIVALAFFNGMVLSLLRWFIGTLRIIPFVGRWIVRGIRLVLTAVSYLMLPIVIYERAGPLNAFQSAWNNVRKTWAGLLIGTSFVFVALWFLFNVFAWTLMRATFGFEESTNVIVAVVTAGIVYSISISVGSAMRAVLYWYATTGEVPSGFNQSDLPRISVPGRITGIGAVAMAGTPSAPQAARPTPTTGTVYATPPQAATAPARRAAVPTPPAARLTSPEMNRPRQQMACPRCHTVIVVDWGQKPTCPTCGYGR